MNILVDKLYEILETYPDSQVYLDTSNIDNTLEPSLSGLFVGIFEDGKDGKCNETVIYLVSSLSDFISYNVLYLVKSEAISGVKVLEAYAVEYGEICDKKQECEEELNRKEE